MEKEMRSPLKVTKGLEVEQKSAPKTSLGRHDKLGREIVDGRPMEPPVGYTPSPSIAEMIKTMVTSALIRQQLQEQGEESFEEANNFDIPDDPADPSSPYEQHYYEAVPLDVLAELEKRGLALHDVRDPNPSQAPGGAGGPLPPSDSGGSGGPLPPAKEPSTKAGEGAHRPASAS